VVLENGPAPLTAVVADSVNEVVELRQEDVEPPPDFGPDVRVDYLTGMARHGRGFVLLLDIDRLLSTLEPARERVAVTVGA
jgi:purine-binding chemotaxis protein CheW